MTKQRYFKILNWQQAKFFLKEGVQLVDIGKTKEGFIYHLFLRDEKGEEAFTKWCSNKK